MKKMKLLKAIPILLFSPLIITGLASCQSVRQEIGIEVESNISTVTHGTFEVNVYDENDATILGDNYKIGHTIKVEAITPEEGYVLDSIIVTFGATEVDITASKSHQIYSSETHYINVLFKKENENTPEPIGKTSKILIDENIKNGLVAFKNHKTGDEVTNSTLVEIVVSANDGFILDTLTVNDIDIKEEKQFKTDEKISSYLVKATFKEDKNIDVKKSLLVIDTSIEHGNVTFKGYENGSQVTNNTTVELNVKADEGYALDTLTVNGIDIKNDKKFVTKDTVSTYVVKASFKLISGPTVKKSEIKIDTNIVNGAVSFTNHENGEKVVNNTKITLKVTPNDNFELETLTVNDKDISDTYSFITDENVEVYLVKATFKKTSNVPNPPVNEGIYSIDFVDFKSDNPLTDFKDKYVDSNNIINSILGNNTYANSKGGVRIGSAKNPGSLTFKLNSNLIITKIVFKTKIYDSNSNFKVRLNNDFVSEKLNVKDGNIELILNSVNSNEIIISNDKDNRFLLSGIEIHTGNSKPEETIKTSIIKYETPSGGSINFEGLENNSTVEINKIVKVNVKPNDGYELDTLTVNNVDIKVAQKFEIKEANITYLVKVTFKKIETNPNPDQSSNLFDKYNCITIPEALNKGTEAGDAGTSVEYSITGTIIKIVTPQYGNMVIGTDSDTIFCYGPRAWDLLDKKPTVGDEIALKGVLKTHNSKPQIFEPEILEIVYHSEEINPEPEIPPVGEKATLNVNSQNMEEGLFVKANNTEGELKSGDIITISYSESATCVVKEIRINGKTYYGDKTNNEFKVTLIPGTNTVTVIYGVKGEETPGTGDYGHYFESSEVQNMGDRGNQGTVDSYYESCRGLKGKALKDELARICQPTERYSYQHNSTSFPITDVDPDDPGMIVLTYTGERRPIPNYGISINREHTWPNSRGAGKTGPGADKHMIRPTENQINSLRSNFDFGVVKHNSTNDCAKYRPENAGNYRDSSRSLFEPKDSYKGDSARMIFYLAITYPQMELAAPENNPSIYNIWNAQYTLGSFDCMYKWAVDTTIDPVSKIEMNRNNVIDITYQHNRNPFIDHPEFVEMIYSKTYVGPGALIK